MSVDAQLRRATGETWRRSSDPTPPGAGRAGRSAPRRRPRCSRRPSPPGAARLAAMPSPTPSRRTGDELAALADRETALGVERLTGEVTRAAGQLRFYGDVAVEGSYLGVTVDRRHRRPRPGSSGSTGRSGPVAVFGASNFPFAFSVLGNDTASALAAGCPVVVKAHPAHVALQLRLAEIARGRARRRGRARGDLRARRRPRGRRGPRQGRRGHRGRLHRVAGRGNGPVAARQRARGGHPRLRRDGHRQPRRRDAAAPPTWPRSPRASSGRSRSGTASSAPSPGSCWPRPGRCRRPRSRPALVDAAPQPGDADRAPSRTSVATGIGELEDAGASDRRAVVPDRRRLVRAGSRAVGADARRLEPGSRLLEECFGAVAVVVEYETADELGRASPTPPGRPGRQRHDRRPATTRTRQARRWQLSSRKVGRVTVNDWPTGVAFTWAQQHGGPWPATSVPSATSVGARPWPASCGRSPTSRPVTQWLPRRGARRTTPGAARGASTAVLAACARRSRHDAAARRRRSSPTSAASWPARSPPRCSPTSAPRWSRSSGRVPATTPASWGPPWTATSSSYFECANRSKKSVELDLDDPEDLAARPRARRARRRRDRELPDRARSTRRGLDYEPVARTNPGVVYCSDHRVRQPRRRRPGRATTSWSRRSAA